MNVAGIINAFAGDYEPDDFIVFADANVKSICVTNWDTNGDGELSYAEAAAVTSLGTVFRNNTIITSFDELNYFTGLNRLEWECFRDCTNLSSIVIPNSVTIIESRVFQGCTGLISVIIPNSVTEIGGQSFLDCSGLTSVVIPSSVQTIRSNSFVRTGLTSLEIPSSVILIEDYAFGYNANLEQIIVDNANAVYDSRNNCNAIIKTNTNKLMVGCKNTIIPNTIVTIDTRAFIGCANLISIDIPNSVTAIKAMAFYECSSLTSIEIPYAVTTVGDNAFSYCTGLTHVSWNAVNVTNCIDPFRYSSNLTEIVFGDNVISIPGYVVCQCYSLNSVVIGNAVTTIGEGAFSDCSGLTTIVIPNNVATIGSTAFQNCTGMTSMTVLATTPPTIQAYTFRNVSKTIPVYVPHGSADDYNNASYWSEFTNIQENPNIAFADNNVKALCVANWDTNGDGELSYEEAAAVTDLGEVFRGSGSGITSFDELQYFTGLTYIQSYAFRSSLVLESVVLPSTITEIRTEAFCDCRSLLSITIPAAVNNIGRLALSCDNMETIIVEEGNTVYDSRDNCNAVIITSSNQLLQGCKNTVIPNTVVSLGGDAFSYSTIESIIIPASITSISYGTFYGCDNLSEITVSEYNTVYDSRNNCNAIIETDTNKLIAGSKTTVIPNTVTTIGEYAFMYRYRTGPYNITIPESVTSIEGYAFYGGFGIESITVLAEVPPTLGEEAFNGVPKDIPVNVPCGTRSAYLAADGWSEFTNINVDTECGRQITVTVNPANTGSVTGAGTYDVGDICTLTATPESGYRFVNWTENNEVVSTNATYQFTVNANRDLVANFEEYVVTNHYVCDISQFADYMSVVAVVVIDGVEQGSETLEIGAFCGDECRGGKFATYFTPTQRYIYQLPVYGEGGDAITFKLYNHDIQQELTIPCTVELQWQKDGYGRLATPYNITFVSSVSIAASVNPANAGTITGAGTYMPGETATLTATANAGYAFANWTEGGNVVSENYVYTFTVEAARTLVANFNMVQSNTLSAGWNWFSTYIEQNGIDGLSMLENSLGEYGEFIQSRTGAVVENFDGSFWWGDLGAITNEDMYEVKTNAQVTVTMTGNKANPASHPIAVAPGWNWIGYVSDAANSVDNALSSLTSNEDDVIQGRNGFSSYFPGYGWYGDIENMMPGQGYMYKSNGTASQTLVYPTATRSSELEAIVYHNQADYNKYRNVMDVMAKVVINGEPANSGRYELAAFVDGECRGRAKLKYVEPLQTYLAFLTINGNDDETVTFSLYDEDLDVTYYASEANVVAFKANEVVGKFRAPYILSFNNAENVENTVFTVYPNPVANGDEITVNFMEEIAEAEVFVENELGLTVDVVKLSGKSAKVRFDLPSGVYVLRIVIDGNVYFNKVIVK